MGQRVAVEDTQFVVNSQPNLSQVLVRSKGNGQTTYYVYGLGLIGEESAGNYFSYHFDFRGSTAALSDNHSVVTERVFYSPFGVLLSDVTQDTPFLFNGFYGVMTDENEPYYMRARYYSPDLRRFVNQDILLGNVGDGQSLNRYAFVTGNPVSFVDPFGLAEISQTITRKQLNDLFKNIQNMDLALGYPQNGCEARAYLISKAILELDFGQNTHRSLKTYLLFRQIPYNQKVFNPI